MDYFISNLVLSNQVIVGNRAVDRYNPTASDATGAAPVGAASAGRRTHLLQAGWLPIYRLQRGADQGQAGAYF